MELPTVVVSKLMGSDGFGGGGGGAAMAVKEVGDRGSDRVSIHFGTSIDRCSSFLSRKDEVGADSASDPACWNKMPDAEHCRHANQLSGSHGEDMVTERNYQNTNGSPSVMPGPEAKHLRRKSGKVARSNSGGSKRSRMAQVEVPTNENGADYLKEKIQIVKQKNHLNGKRGDKRNGKVPMKSKYDSFSLKAGLLSFSSSAAGNNILGVCGSKPDINDVTNHVDELSLNELLNGSYKCSSFAKDKGKKVENLNESLLSSVKKACSVLRLQKPIRPQSFSEVDNSYNRKVSTSIVSSGSCVAGKIIGEEGDSCATDRSSFNKSQVLRSKLETHVTMLDCPLYNPEDILERIALPPPKDLDSLLLDAAKPVSSSRNNPDPRLAKPVSHRSGLPPFPWSHSSGANCKSNSDAVKVSTNRITCQSRWVKIGKTGTSSGVPTGFLVDLESLVYDQNLVPSANLKSEPSETANVSSRPHGFPFCGQGLLSSASCSLSSQDPPEAGEGLKSEGNAGHSPRLLAAAQTLYDIATDTDQNQNVMMKWPKKPSQKAMKARKLKSNEKPEEKFIAIKSVEEPDDQTLPLKKPRVSTNEKSNYFNHSSSPRKGPINWSTPRSSRSSPSKSLRDSVAETKKYDSNLVNQLCTVPPPPRNSQQKLRKVMLMDWGRVGGKMD